MAVGVLENSQYLLVGTDGIQCLAMSAPLPLMMNTDLHSQSAVELEFLNVK